MVELIILRKNGLAAKLSDSSAVAFCYTMGEGREWMRSRDVRFDT